MNDKAYALNPVGKLAAAIPFLGCALLAAFSGSARLGAENGIKACLGVLVPSLFPFMALSTLAARLSGGSGGGISGRICKALFKTSGALAPVLLLGLLGGYPVGAAGIAQLKKSGALSEKEAEKAALFAVCPGPGFSISYFGSALLGVPEIGMIIYAAQVASVLVLGIATGIIFGKDDYYSVKEINRPKPDYSTALVESVSAAVSSMLKICGLVILFSALISVADGLIKNEQAVTALCSLLEVTSASARLSGAPLAAAFALGFGGICVHMQIFTALGDIKVNKPLFFLYRIIQGLLTCGLTKLGLMLWGRSAQVFSTANASQTTAVGGTVISGAVLFAVSLCFLFSLNRNTKNQKMVFSEKRR